jgi:hypothetical protein
MELQGHRDSLEMLELRVKVDCPEKVDLMGRLDRPATEVRQAHKDPQDPEASQEQPATRAHQDQSDNPELEGKTDPLDLPVH